MRRIRTAAQHRGWTAQQRTPKSVAKDIATSIHAKRQKGIVADIADYTHNADTIAMITALLHKAA